MWIYLHAPSMIIVPACSIAAFVLILSDSDWKWLTTDIALNFAHSIIGITAIGLSIFQVLFLI